MRTSGGGNPWITAIRSPSAAVPGPGPGGDVMAGIEELRRRPYVSPGKPAVTGWSYGGHKTNPVIGNHSETWPGAKAGAPGPGFIHEEDRSGRHAALRFSMGGAPRAGGPGELRCRRA